MQDDSGNDSELDDEVNIPFIEVNGNKGVIHSVRKSDLGATLAALSKARSVTEEKKALRAVRNELCEHPLQIILERGQKTTATFYRANRQLPPTMIITLTAAAAEVLRGFDLKREIGGVVIKYRTEGDEAREKRKARFSGELLSGTLREQNGQTVFVQSTGNKLPKNRLH